MSDAKTSLTCSSCGLVFVPPQGLTRCFCPGCGTSIQIQQSTPSESVDKAMASAQEAARMAEEAVRLAQQAAASAQQLTQNSGQLTPEAMAALAAAQQAAEQARQLSESAKATAQSGAQVAEAAHQQAAEQVARNAEQIAAQRAAEETQRAAEEQRRAAQQAAEQAARQEAQRAAQRAAQQQAAAQQAAAQQQPIQYRRNAVVRGNDGRGYFVVTIPTDWAIDDTAIENTGSSSKPFLPYVRFTDHSTAFVSLSVGMAGTRNSESVKAMMAMYGGAIAGVDTANYADMPNPRVLADNNARPLMKGASNARLIREVGAHDLAHLKQDAWEQYQQMARISGGTPIKDPFAAEVTRIYEFTEDGRTWRLAEYVRLYAVRDASGVDAMAMMNPMGLAFGLGGVIGGMIAGRRAKQKQQREQVSATTAPTNWSTENFEAYAKQGTIFWDVCATATLMSTPERFDQVYEQVFLPLVTSFSIHPDIRNMAASVVRQEASAVQQATNRQISNMNAQFQASQAAARQAQAAADARFASWQAQSDAHHAAFRERTNAQFRDSNVGGGVGDWSEAIRGVNTFVTTDGREVELDVSADRAYQNQAGDVIGGSGGFDPGADWTEIPRA